MLLASVRGTNPKHKPERNIMAKIQIGKVNQTNRSMKQAVLDAGIEMSRDDSGKVVLTLKFPGVDAIAFSQESLGLVVNTLDRRTEEGDDPGATFARTATEDPEGNMVAKFSDAARSRTLSFTRKDREDVAQMLENFIGSWEGYEAQLAEAEAEAAAEAAAKAAKAAK